MLDMLTVEIWSTYTLARAPVCLPRLPAKEIKLSALGDISVDRY